MNNNTVAKLYYYGGLAWYILAMLRIIVFFLNGNIDPTRELLAIIVCILAAIFHVVMYFGKIKE